LPSTVWKGLKINLSKAKVIFSGEESDLSDGVKSLVSTVEKTAGLPRSQGYLLPRNDMSSKTAFTLAEVLITLGIIGVVAAMTLPALIQNYQKAQAVSQLKRSYAVVQNAVEFIRGEYDGIDMNTMPFVHMVNGHPKYFDMAMFADELSKHLNYLEKGYHSAYSDEVKMCLPENTDKSYKWANASKQTGWGVVRYWWKLNDGSCIGFNSRGNNQNWVEGNDKVVLFYIDINGSDKNPNQFGKDTFVFELLHSGKVIPFLDNSTDHSCALNGSSAYKGLTCANKIINDGWQIKHDYPWK